MQLSLRNLLFYRCLLVLWSLIVLPGWAWAEAEVKSIRLGVHADHTRVVLDLSEPTVFQVEPQTRADQVVIAVEGARFRLGSQPAPAGGLIKSIRVAEGSGGGERLIVDLAQPAHVSQSQLLYATASAPARIFVDLRAGSSLPADSPAAEAQAPGSDGKARPADGKERPVQVASTVAVAIPDSAAAEPAEAPTAAADLPPVPPVKPEPPADEDGIGSLVAMLGAPSEPPEEPAASTDGRKPVIVLDAGHGGKDPGAIGANGTMEKDITFKMAKELKALLEGTGRYKVILTRETDVLLALRERMEIARAAEADLFISLHADHIEKSTLRGASVYTLSENASDAEAASLAARENKEDLITGVNLSSQNAMVTSILIDLAQRETKNMSARFASLLADELAEHTQLVSNSHRFAGFVVLKAPDVPSVLVELGYLSNSDDEAALGSKRHRRILGKAVRDAVDRFFEWQRGVRRS